VLHSLQRNFTPSALAEKLEEQSTPLPATRRAHSGIVLGAHPSTHSPPVLVFLCTRCTSMDEWMPSMVCSEGV
jgi:hypothetical protein